MKLVKRVVDHPQRVRRDNCHEVNARSIHIMAARDAF